MSTHKQESKQIQGMQMNDYWASHWE